jgi:hypothetical protein
MPFVTATWRTILFEAGMRVPYAAACNWTDGSGKGGCVCVGGGGLMRIADSSSILNST